MVGDDKYTLAGGLVCLLCVESIPNLPSEIPESSREVPKKG